MNHADSLNANPGGGSLAPALPGSTPPVELRHRTRDAWQEGLLQHLLALDCSVADAPSFECRTVVARLQGMTAAELRVEGARLHRRTADIERDDTDAVQIVCQLAGRSRVQQGPNSALLEAGNWTLCGTGREYTIDLGRGTRVLLVLVPRMQCLGWLPALHALGTRTLQASAAGNVALAALTAMLRDGAALDGGSEAILRDLVIALFERALTLELEARGLDGPAERQIRLPQVQTYILEHLADAALNVARLAGVFGMSRRSLYNLFVPSGVTPHAYIQSSRLERACELLDHPAARGTAVASIARQCGFADPAHFSRAFHGRFGVAPTAWRSRAS